jgi:hypothetical protein
MKPAFAVMPGKTTHNTRTYLLGRGWTSVSSLFVRSFVRSFDNSKYKYYQSIYSLAHSLAHSLTHSLAHSFIHSFTRSLAHSFILRPTPQTGYGPSRFLLPLRLLPVGDSRIHRRHLRLRHSSSESVRLKMEPSYLLAQV